MGLVLKKEIEDWQKEEQDMLFYYKNGREIAYGIFATFDEELVELCASILHTCLLQVYNDYYNIYYGRPRIVWRETLEKHIVSIREAAEMMILYNFILTQDLIPDYIFTDDPVIKYDLTFPKVAQLIWVLLDELQTYNRVAIFFK